MFEKIKNSLNICLVFVFSVIVFLAQTQCVLAFALKSLYFHVVLFSALCRSRSGRVASGGNLHEGADFSFCNNENVDEMKIFSVLIYRFTFKYFPLSH